MSHEDHFNIINAARNYLFIADDKKDGKDHIAECRPDASDYSSSLDQDKFWWKLEEISGDMIDGLQCFRILNAEYGYLFATDKDIKGGKSADVDHWVEARLNPSSSDLANPKFKWTIARVGRRVDWCAIKNVAYGHMFAADGDKDGRDHIVECRPSGDHDDLKFGWFVLNRVELDKWMKYIPDDLSLSAISIPGTHDSGTVGLAPGLGLTQDLDMFQQLRIGTRFIDCRLQIQSGPNGIKLDKLCFAHELVQISWIEFDWFVKQVLIPFLSTRHKECVILSIHDDESRLSDEWEWQTFAELVSRTIHDPETSDYWYTENRIPRMSEIRKKIVLIRRYKTSGDPNIGTPETAHGSIGINARNNWDNNTIFTATNGDVVLNVQDVYSLESSDEITAVKWPVVRNHLRNAQKAHQRYYFDETLYINFLSAVGTKGNAGKPTSRTVADVINPKTLDYLNKSDQRTGRYGNVLFDFVTAKDNCAIIASNSLQE